MRRLHLFELHDQPWVPAPIRESVVESLGRTLRWGRLLRGLLDPFQAFLSRSGSAEVLDLCSGSGAPVEILIDELGRGGAAVPRFVLTDLSPRRELWEVIRAAHPERISYEGAPVDAARVSPALAAGRARMILNAFHHFPPPVARAILLDAAASGRGIFIAENFERSPLHTFPVGFFGMPATFANPALTRQRRLWKAILTWLLPIVPLAVLWDGLVSSLRVYTEGELRAMVEGAPELEWVYGTFSFWPLGRGMYFYGVPRAPR